MNLLNIFKIFPIIASVIGFVITMNILLKKSNNGYYDAIKKFKEDESVANSTTKKFINLDLHYIKPNIEKLPFKKYENTEKNKKLLKFQDIVRKKATLKMIKLPTHTTNTDMKKLFGVNNFKEITILEEHYNNYVKALYDWANELFIQKNYADCENILLEAVRIQGNISSIYTMLSAIYSQKNDTKKLAWLKKTVDSYDLYLKDKILKNIENNIIKNNIR